MSVKSISSFSQIHFINELQYLIICDIDETILHFPDCDRFCKEWIKSNKILYENYDTVLKELKLYYKRLKAPSPTDYDGFINMMRIINKTNSKFLFLTARSYSSDALTKTHLKNIGLITDEMEIHYTGEKISKGEYIKKNIDLSVWTYVIFIDNDEINIKTVTSLCPQIDCYQFFI